MAYALADASRIGDRIKGLRESKGMTIDEFSSFLGISTSAVTMYETGKRIPRDEIKIRIANFFAVSVESIFYPKKQHET